MVTAIVRERQAVREVDAQRSCADEGSHELINSFWFRVAIPRVNPCMEYHAKKDSRVAKITIQDSRVAQNRSQDSRLQIDDASMES